MNTARAARWTRREKLAVWAVIILLTAARLALLGHVWSSQPQFLYTPDSSSYTQPAHALLSAGRFLAAPQPDALPEITRTPGYPVFLAACYAVSGGRDVAALAAQAVLSGGIALLLYGLARRVAGRGAACAALAFYALDVNGSYLSIMMLTETWFTLTLMGAVALALPLLRGAPARWPRCLAISLLLGWAALIRPIAYLLSPLMALGLAVLCWRRLAGRGRAAMAAALVLPVCVLIGGWQARNGLVAGDPHFAWIAHRNLLEYRAAGVVMYRDGVSFNEAQRRVLAPVEHALRLPPRQAGEIYDRAAMAILKPNPRLVLKVTLLGLRKMLLYADDGSGITFLTGRLPVEDPFGDFAALPLARYWAKWMSPALRLQFEHAAWCAAHLYAAYLFALAGVVALARRRRWRWFLLLVLMLIAYQVIVPAGPEAYTRFRIPFAPLLYLLSGVGAARLFCARRDRRSSPPRQAGAAPPAG